MEHDFNGASIFHLGIHIFILGSIYKILLMFNNIMMNASFQATVCIE